MMRVSDVRTVLAQKLAFREFVTDKSGVRTIELTGQSFLADEPVIFGKASDEWHEREFRWYQSMSRNVNDIEPPVPEIWKRVADPDGYVNSNYGWMIWSEANGYQYQNAVEELKRNPDSRRAVMIYQRPSMWREYDRDGMSDFVCTNAVQYLVRPHGLGGDPVVDAIVQMRSSDLIFGYKGDLYWQQRVLGMVSEDLGIPPGNIYWQAGSAHVYERHFYLVDAWEKLGKTHIPKSYYAELYPDSEWA